MSRTSPEREMVRRALLPGAIAVPVAFAAGLAFGDAGDASSAAIGVGVVLANFVAHALSLEWASRISISAVHAVALGGVILRLGAIVGLLFALNTMDWFSPLAFGLAVVPGTLALLAYEAKLTIGGVGAALQIPADPVAVRAAEQLAAREAS
ncbi:MAG: hypothetical protein ACXWEH_01530 [Actinomycetota bacterium]